MQKITEVTPKWELALKLKEAGFRQDTDVILAYDGEVISCPTLSELIEACGDKFASLTREVQTSTFKTEGWVSYLYDSILEGKGSTPEEAVANLWLALNTK